MNQSKNDIDAVSLSRNEITIRHANGTYEHICSKKVFSRTIVDNWQRWFAWRPVRTRTWLGKGAQEWVWLKYVLKRPSEPDSGKYRWMYKKERV